MSEDQVLQDLLRQELKILDKSISHILYSQAKVQAIDLNASLSPDELELFDSFSSRFLRLYEVLFNQVIRTTLGLFKEVQKTTLDNMNKAEQLDLITSQKDLNEIRKLRNQVAHEYLEEQWIQIYRRLLQFTEPLLQCCQCTRKVIQLRFPEVFLDSNMIQNNEPKSESE